MAESALTSALVLEKLNRASRAPRRRRRSSVKGKRGKKKRSTRNRKWKWVKTVSGFLYKAAKDGFMKTPAGRYVRKTIENLAKYYPDALNEYADENATRVPGPPGAAV